MPKHLITGEQYVEGGSYRYVWRRAENLRSGDKVHRCGYDMEVEGVRPDNGEVIITVKDPVHGRREWRQKPSDTFVTLSQ